MPYKQFLTAYRAHVQVRALQGNSSLQEQIAQRLVVFPVTCKNVPKALSGILKDPQKMVRTVCGLELWYVSAEKALSVLPPKSTRSCS